MGMRKHDTFRQVRPSLLSQELDPALAEETFKARKLEPDWLPDGEYFHQLVMDMVRVDVAMALLGFINRNNPTLGDFVRAKRPVMRHPLLMDEQARTIMNEHNARTLCYVASIGVFRERPDVMHVLEPEAISRMICPAGMTIDKRVAAYAEERLIQQYGKRLVRVLA